MSRKESFSTAWLVVALLLEAGVLSFLGPAAEAAYSTCGTPVSGNLFDGREFHPPTFKIRGTQAVVNYRIPDLCAGQDNDSTVWTMILSGDKSGYAQSGFITKNYGSTPHRFFWEWWKQLPNGTDQYCSTPPCLHTGVYGAPVEAASNKFTTSRYSSDGFIHLLKDLVDGPPNGQGVPSTTSFDPLNTWALPLLGQWFGEIMYYESDFPGTSNYRTNFTEVKEKDDNGTWWSNGFSSDWTPGQDTCFAKLESISGSVADFRIYTEPVTRSHSGNNCT